MDADLKQYLEAMEGRLNERFVGLENGLVEKMRDMQTELYAVSRRSQSVRRSGYARWKWISRTLMPRSQAA